MKVLVCKGPVVLIHKLEGATYGCYSNRLLLCPDICTKCLPSKITVKMRQIAELRILSTLHAAQGLSIAACAVSPTTSAQPSVALLLQCCIVVKVYTGSGSRVSPRVDTLGAYLTASCLVHGYSTKAGLLQYPM